MEGRRKSTIEDETSFCSSATLEGVLKAKNVFDNLEEEEVAELRRAQAKCNPYELTRGAFFMNRSAIKMANIDAALRFQLTNPTDKSGVSVFRIILINLMFIVFQPDLYEINRY